MTHPFPPPQIQPLERLHPSDGLLINAERWRKAHEYHRQRQNTQYQSLNQPGIVWGLGVRPIPAPQGADAKYRDGRWVQIQPGIAIDINGNLIVVPQPFNYPLDLEVVGSEPLTIYLVVNYIDPDQLREKQQRDIVQERYDFIQRNYKPDPSEIEICRIILAPGQKTITQPADVFSPRLNDINLLYRRQAYARPQALLRMANIQHGDPEYSRNFRNLDFLLQSVEALYPPLRGADEVYDVPLSGNIQEYDLLYYTGKQSLSLNTAEFESLKNYLNLGGTLLIDAPFDAEGLSSSTQALAQQLGTPLKAFTELKKLHPLRIKPFLFGSLPNVGQQFIKLYLGGGIILIEGDLGALWGTDKNPDLPRLIIRTAQELGINILHYAWKRRQMIGLQQEDNLAQW
jgi:hypothetical protein